MSSGCTVLQQSKDFNLGLQYVGIFDVVWWNLDVVVGTLFYTMLMNNCKEIPVHLYDIYIDVSIHNLL